MKLKKADIIIAVIIVVIAAGMAIYFTRADEEITGPVAVITDAAANVVIAEIPIDHWDNGIYEYETAYASVPFGVEIKDGEIAMNHIECPDGICMSMGFVNNSYFPIICLPNALIIEIVDEEDRAEIDGAAG